MNEATCAWTEVGDGDFWETSCGEAFALNDGTPFDNGMSFCCYCGLPLERPEPIAEEEARS